MPEPMNDNARIVRDFIVASCPNPERLLAALTALESELATAKADLARVREEERDLEESNGVLRRKVDAALESLTEARKVLGYIAGRSQLDVDDGGRPDQWSMQDMIRMARAALAPEQKG